MIFSDGSVTPLRDIDRDAYSLRVQSLDSEVVAFAPMLGSAHPRVIAVGEGMVLYFYLVLKNSFLFVFF